MKNYEEMAKDLFERREEYERQQERKKKQKKRIVLYIASIGIVVVGSFGIWKSGMFLPDSAYVQMADSQINKENDRKQEEQKVNETTGNGAERESALSSNMKITQKKKENGTDKRVTAVNPVDLEGADYNYTKVVEEQISRFRSADYADPMDLDSLSEQAAEIVAGTVKKVTYDVVDGEIWTNLDISITDVFKGKLVKKDKISVYRLGGYILLKEYQKYHDDVERFGIDAKEISHTLLKQVCEGEEFPQVGEESVYYLNKETANDLLPKGAYERISGKYGELKVVKESGNLLQFQDAREKLYTWKEVQKKAEKWNKD